MSIIDDVHLSRTGCLALLKNFGFKVALERLVAYAFNAEHWMVEQPFLFYQHVTALLNTSVVIILRLVNMLKPNKGRVFILNILLVLMVFFKVLMNLYIQKFIFKKASDQAGVVFKWKRVFLYSDTVFQMQDDTAKLISS